MKRNGLSRSILTTMSGHATRLVLAAALIAAVMPAPAAAQDASYGVPGDWLSDYVSARAVGLGGAFVAAADDPLGAVWNPAGLVLQSQNAFALETARYFEGTSVNAFSFTVPARTLPTIGFTMLALNSGDFERTNELNESLGEFKQSDMAFLISGSKAFSPRFSVGANIKIIRQQVEDADASGVGFDMGLMYGITPRVRLGASVLNIGGPTLTARDVEESFPLEVRGGLGLGYLNGKGLLSLEVDHRDGPGTTFRAGTEVWLYEAFGLRAGFFESEPAGGFSYRLNQGLQFDYGMSDHDLGIIHRVALSYRFGGFFATSTATPQVFSPLGENSVTKFEIKARTKAETREWHLAIVDKHGETVRSFGGLGVPPAHVMWDGKDENGMTLPDGIYHYRMTVTDDEGRVLRTENKTVEITTSGPQGSVPVIVH
ncbi:MAG: PorV/PorQ family protein [Candidatus Krumholzibacteria bacterium]|nr:PorV/PorQ family protein [Candidatus Krumholzibacteria bacterium]MDH4335752.1 PorV/PorQ family protein [Candidatus Krumholzibacteria bacterium]MDH5269278.1 PorV/PorQ family protein [Candidatus Krumholzibacteria bacterium]